MSTIHVATVQFRPRFGELAGNRRRVAQLVGQVRGADLIVLPELAFSGYAFADRAEAARLAEPASMRSESVRLLAQLASETGATIVSGLCEDDAGVLYNSAVVVRPGEGLVGTYRKLHLFDRETFVFEPGAGYRAFELPLRDGGKAKLGVLICFDWFFVESWRVLALDGVDVVALPANLVIPGNCQSSLPTLARLNRMAIVMSNRYGEERRLRFTGEAQIVDSRGQVVHQSPLEADDVGTAAFDLATIRDKQVTAHNHLFGSRRPELYGPLCEPRAAES